MGGNSLQKLRWIWFRFDKEGTKGFTGKEKCRYEINGELKRLD